MVTARPPEADTQLTSPQPGPEECAPDTLRTLAMLARHWLRRGIRRRDAIGAALRRVDPLVDQARSVDQAGSMGAPAMPTHHPMIRHLAAALDGFRGLEALAQSGPWLPWRNVDDLDPSCAMPANQLARAEIIGPEGPLRHPAFCLGFLLMAPSSDYASSDYASSDYAVQAGLATELHHIVSGHACWTVGEATEERRSGDFILHPSPMRHAIRTAEESLLTIYIRTRSASSPPGFMP